MKDIKVSGLLFFLLVFVAAGFTACDKSDDEIVPDEVITLTTDEKTNLLFMREEEKLARDVYLYMYGKYQLRIFNNIASSEQVHMNAVLELIEKYGLEDPASTERGIFTSLALQQLYDDLIAQGQLSLIEALKAGATIEDVDIRDLDNAIEGTVKEDLIDLYEMLKCGSTNHMRGFSSHLTNEGVSYTPQFITQEQYDEILQGEHEHCGR